MSGSHCHSKNNVSNSSVTLTDFLLTNARTLDDSTIDIEISDGTIDTVVPTGDGDPSRFDDDQRYDGDSRLVTPPLIEPYTNLDSALIDGSPYWNRTNTLKEGWRRWTEIHEEPTKSEIKHGLDVSSSGS